MTLRSLRSRSSPRRHQRALPHAEVGAALARVRASGAHAGTVLAFEFLVLTAAHSGEVRNARWEEFDLEGAVWTIPAERMKAGREHRVRLSPRALAVLDEARRRTPRRRPGPPRTPPRRCRAAGRRRRRPVRSRRSARPAPSPSITGSVSGLQNGSVVRVTAADAAVFARNGAAERPAARLVWSVLMDDPGCLRASPDPHRVTRCDSPWTRFHAGHCGGRGVPRGSRPQPCRFRCQVSWWRALRARGTPGQDCPGADMSPRATDWRLHAREPPVPAHCGLFTATKPSSRFGTRHIVQMQRGGPVAPLLVRHPGPRVSAAGCCTPAPSGPATTAAQSGQRHASYHPPRPVMSAARDKVLSIPCRARLRAARHYRAPAPGDMPR